MNKKIQDMNSLVKFTVDGLRLTVDRLQLKEGGRRLGRCVMLVAAMLLGGMTAQAQWTDPSTGVTFTPIDGSNGTGDEGWAKGCDGIITTKHGGQPNALPHNLVVRASQAVKLTGYTITTANDNSSYTGRSPYTWKVQGSNTNNGSDWVDIATETQNSTLKNVNYIEYEFSCTTNNYYTYFRFHITAINGGDYMQYSEFHPIGEKAGAYAPGTSGGGGTYGPNNVGYVITNGSVYLGGTSTTAIDSFNPQTCLWSTTGTSSVVWRNTAGYNLYSNNSGSTLSLNASSTRTWDLVGSESGTTGMRIRRNSTNYYVYLNGSTWATANNTTANIAFAVTKTTHYATYTVPEIGGATEISVLGVSGINNIACSAAYRQKYYDYIFRNGAHHYVDDDDATSRNSAPSASEFSYTWSLEGAGGYATIDVDNGNITYSRSTTEDLNVTVKLTASSTKKTYVVTKTVTLHPVPIYYRVNVTSEPSAGGNVYVNLAENGSATQTSAYISGFVYGTYPTTTIQPYLNATANSGYEFKWWSATSGGVSANGDAACRPELSITSTDSELPTVHNYYAQFGLKPTFYFSATAVASAGGTASASVASSVLGEHWNSTSATTTATFTATPNTGYALAGWSETENGAIISTDNPYTVDDFSSTSTNSESPATLTRYAHFLALPTAITTSEASLSLCAGGNGTFTYSLTPAEAYENVAITSNNTGIATVSTSEHTVTVTAVAAGNTSIALAAKNASGEVLCGATVSVTVPTKWSTPSISYNDATGKINITSDDGATIYYNTGDGSQADPTTLSTLYTDGGFTQSTATTIKAIAVGEGHCPSEVASLALGKPATPVITYADNTVTITCATEGATIYYSYGASPATPNTSYSAPFTLPESPTKIKAVAILQGISSDAATTENLYIKLPAPTITINNTGVATITAEYDATIRDSVSGAATWSNYTSGVQLTNPQTIYACAIKEGYIGSDTVWKDFISTGTGGDKVVLDDREDHSWSYYSSTELPKMMRSLNPADVKITYYGNGTNNVNVTTNSTTPGNNDWTSSATSVQVSSSETENTFIYFKTLERTDGSTANTVEGATGRCKYTAIPNPFSKRPSFTISATKYYTGFYKWRVKTLRGGTIHDAATGGNSIGVGGTIDGDQTIYFAPSSEYGMEVELEALWARAYTTTGTNDLGTYVSGTNAYERNFHVVTSSQNASSYQKSYGCTVSSYYPDGTSGGGSVSGAFTAAGPTKFENIAITGATNQTWNANGKDLIIGRGVTGVVNYLYGLDGNSSTTFRLRIESGEFNYWYMLGSGRTFTGTLYMTAGNDYDRARNYHTYPDVNTDILLGANCTLGSARGDEKAFITIKSGNYDLGSYGENNQFYCSVTNGKTYSKRTVVVEGGIFSDLCGGMESSTTYAQASNLMFDMRVKGGTLKGAIYGGAQSSTTYGIRRMIFTGGNVTGWIAGAANGNASTNGDMTGTTYVYVGGRTNVDSDGSTTLINRSVGGNVFAAGCGFSSSSSSGTVSAGTNVAIADEAYVERGVYGGGSFGYTTATANIYLMGGTVGCIGGGVTSAGTGYSSTVQGGVYGGACQNQAGTNNVKIYGGRVNGGVYGGGNVSGTVAGPITVDVYGTSEPASPGGYAIQSVYGGGNAVAFSGTPTVTVHCGDVISVGNVFGGGNAATVNGTNVTVNGGNHIGKVFGGGNAAGVNGNSVVAVNGGLIDDAIYGGCNSNGTVSGTVSVTLGSAANCQHPLPDVFGGGYGASTGTGNNVTVTVGDGSNTPTVSGDVYGGSALGQVNDASSEITKVWLKSGTINGNLYGGGLGEEGAGNVTKGQVNGKVQVVVDGGTVTGGVYGCNNTNGSPQSTVNVDINDTDHPESGYALSHVFGGGNQAAYDGTPVVKVHNCDNSIEYVYGGGNAASVTGTDVTIYGGNTIGNVFGGCYGANVTTSGTLVKIYGGTIGKVFGGNDQTGSITGGISVTVDKQTEAEHSSCPMHITEVYGGGNVAGSAPGSITVNCTGTFTDWNNYEGIEYLYGGANQADISGNISLLISKGTIKNVFGGNNTSGDISGTITVNVTKADNCMHLYNVFGGGNEAPYGDAEHNKGNYPVVNINHGTVDNNVFGGGLGETAIVYGNPQVTIGDAEGGHTAIVTHDVYGGGDAANVSGTPVVLVKNCNTRVDYVYGGGNAAAVSATNVTITGGTVNYVFGGGHGDKDATPSPIGANVTGNTSVLINDGTIAHVFGGANSYGTIGGTISTTVTKSGSCGLHITELYGGGNYAASQPGSITVNCTGTFTDWNNYEGIEYLYGGANRANISGGNITLNITKGTIKNVFGGNNNSGTISGTITVNVTKADNCMHLYNVFGGGNLAPYSGGPAVNIKHGTVDNNVYGGGKGGSAVVTGNPVVTIGDADGEHTAIVTHDVYGGGDAAAVTGNTTVTYNDNNASSTVANLFGGGNAAGVSGTATVNMTLGKVTAGIYGGCNSSGTVSGLITVNLNGGQVGTSTTAADVYGGGLGEATRTTGSINVKLNGSNVYGDIYGGSALGQVNTTTVDILDGTVHQVNSLRGNVFGGGRGEAGAENVTKGQVNGKVIVNIGATDGEETPTYTGNATIEGFVFGCNNTNGSPQDDVEVHVYMTGHNTDNRFSDFTNTISDNDTLGALAAVAALLESATPADVTEGNAFFALKAVYGGGNLADYVPASGKKTTVTIHGCEENTIKYVYGGGCAASVNETHVVIEGGHIYQAFAGGDGSNGVTGANVGQRTVGGTTYGTGNTSLAIHGGAVYQAFAGSNTLGLIKGSSSIDLDKTCDHQNVYEAFIGNNLAPTSGERTVEIECGTQWNTVYGGNNKAGHTGDITLTITGGKMARVFGGSKSADITGNVTVNVNGGHIGEVFGGNNVSGNISGTITVNVDINPAYSCEDGLALTTVYGGGRDAAYVPFDCFRFSPMVNIKHTSTLQLSEVFGGGYGATAKTVSYPRVIVGGFGNGKVARVYNNVYGGGYGAPVYGNTVALVRSSIIGNDGATTGTVFGGGYGTTAVIHGETYVGVFGTSDIRKNVYGGGNAGAVLGSTDVQVAYEEQLLPPETRAVMEDGTVYATLVSSTPGATIRYTLDGTAVPTPTTGEEFTGSRFEIDFADNIQAIAYKEGMIPSVVSVNQTPTPTITIDGASATLDGYIGSRLYYTTDGTEPTTSSSLYGGAAVDETGYNPASTPISVTANSVIKVMAVMRGCANSHVAYLQAPEPTISLVNNSCTITGPAGSRIIYTTFTDTPSGSNPTSAMGGGTEHGTKVSEADDDDDDNTSVKETVPLTDGETLKAIVELDGYMPSNISAVKYVAP